MKDKSREELESTRPRQITALEGIEFSLDRLYADRNHDIGDMIVHSLSFEELIGALLLARDDLHLREE